MKRADLEAYVRRDWSAALEVDPSDDGRDARNPFEIFAAIDALRAQAHAMHADFPSAEDRQADLDAHIALAAKFHRAARAR